MLTLFIFINLIAFILILNTRTSLFFFAFQKDAARVALKKAVPALGSDRPIKKSAPEPPGSAPISICSYLRQVGTVPVLKFYIEHSLVLRLDVLDNIYQHCLGIHIILMGIRILFQNVSIIYFFRRTLKWE